MGYPFGNYIRIIYMSCSNLCPLFELGSGVTCKAGGTNIKLQNWKGIHSFQFAIIVGCKSCARR